MSFSQRITLDLLREFPDKMNWDMISYFQKINTETYLEFRDKLDWVCIIIGCKKNKIDFDLINLIDSISTIEESINTFYLNNKRHPLTRNLWKDNEFSGAPVTILKEKLKPLINMMLLINRFRLCASKIKRQWKKCISNPEYKLCRDILHHDFGLLINI